MEIQIKKMSNLKERIEAGLSGKFRGLDNGFTDINKYIFGVQKKCYTLLGGASGSYKTTLLDYIILHALRDAIKKGIPIDIFYYSFEIDALSKQCSWISQIVYLNYGIEIPPERIKGLGDNRLSLEEQEIVNSVIPEVEELFSKIKFVFEPTNSTGIYNDVFKHCAAQGELVYTPYTDENNVEQKRITGFIPKDFRYTIIAVDHIALQKCEKRFATLKENLDKLSSYFVILRNVFDVSIFALQQFNQGLNAVDRQKFKGIDISPSQNDYKDSTNPYTDADVVLATMNAHKLDLETCLGYDIKKLRDRFIMLKIIKNRLSRDNIAKGLYVHPQSGRFEELPKSEEFKKNPKLYEQYAK